MREEKHRKPKPKKKSKNRNKTTTKNIETKLMATFWHFNFNFTTTFQSDQLTIVMYSVTGNWTIGVMAEWLKPPSVLT